MDEPPEIPENILQIAQDRDWQRGTLQGWGVQLFPVKDGWRVRYYSIASWESEPGTTFPSFDEAVAAIQELLPKANSLDEKQKALEAAELGWYLE